MHRIIQRDRAPVDTAPVILHRKDPKGVMAMSGSYNLCQQAFVLSYLSNMLVSLAQGRPNSKANLEVLLHKAITDHLGKHTAEMGEWEIVWGPAVFINNRYQQKHTKPPPKDGEGIADNVTYVAKKRVDPPVYVVATAGTNKYSSFGGRVEDLKVGSTVAWTHAFTRDLAGKPLLKPYGKPPGVDHPCLSKGTATGVRAVLSTAPGAISPRDATPDRLFEYLAGLQPNHATLIITGHSLGGALAPTLALALVNPEGGPLDAKQWGRVYCLPLAGATPGNADFAKAYAQAFPGVPQEVPADRDPSKTELWNRNIANMKDFVPLAWIPGHLKTIPPDRDGKGGFIRTCNGRTTT